MSPNLLFGPVREATRFLGRTAFKRKKNRTTWKEQKKSVPRVTRLLRLETLIFTILLEVSIRSDFGARN